jgi:hypothetical protein
MPNQVLDWPGERLRRLAELWPDPTKTVCAIGRELGVGEEAVRRRAKDLGFKEDPRASASRGPMKSLLRESRVQQFGRTGTVSGPAAYRRQQRPRGPAGQRPPDGGAPHTAPARPAARRTSLRKNASPASPRCWCSTGVISGASPKLRRGLLAVTIGLLGGIR